MNSNPYKFRVDLDDNADREIDNPLAHFEDLDELDKDAAQFANRVSPNAPDVDLWKRAARVARDPLGSSPETVPGLTAQEDVALKTVKLRGFWQQPKPLRITIATLCIGAIIQGWTQTGINGANLSWIIEFGLADQNGNITATKNNWIFSGVNAITYLAAGIFGCWLSDPLQSWLLGRRGAIFVSGLLILASVVGCACSHSWQQLMACRALLGLGMGAKASVVPIMGAEVAPPHLRGALVMNWQLMDALGIFFGFTANLIVAKIGPLAWRFQMVSAAIPTLCLLSLIWTLPESPRFLLKKGRLGEAYETLLTLRETPLLAARELYYANAQIQAEVSLLPKREGDAEADGQNTGFVMPNGDDKNNQAAQQRRRHSKGRVKSAWHYISRHVDESELDLFQRRLKKTTYFTRLWQLFRDKRTRRATLAAFVVMIGQQLCGINVLEFYSSTFFNNVNNNTKPMEALWLSWGLGLANFLFTFPVYYLIDKRGRRFLLLATYPGMILSMLAACLSFLIKDNQSARSGVIAFFIFVFFFFYSWGQGEIVRYRALIRANEPIGPVAFAYSSEIFPLLNREQGMSFAVFINLFGAGLLTLFVPELTTSLSNYNSNGQSSLLGVFVGFNILSLLLIFFFVPETAGATLGKQAGSLNYISLEELNYIFGVSTAKHIAYQLKHVVPWTLRRCSWRLLHPFTPTPAGSDDRPEELYTWVNVRNIKKEEKQERRVSKWTAEEEQPHYIPDDS